MWLDDRVKYPMSFFIEVKLSGEVDRDVMETSLSSALQRHPLLTAHLKTSLMGSPRWLDAQDIAEIDWSDGSPNLPSLIDRFIDLKSHSGLRIWGNVGPETTRLVFQFHHAVTDGIGAIEFIGDLLAYYGKATCGINEAPELAPVSLETLSKRGQLWEPGHEHQKLFSHLMWWTAELGSSYPTGLQFETKQAEPVNDPFVTRILDGKQTRKLKREATRQGCTPNELYTLAMFQSLRQWALNQGDGSDRQAIRVGIPFSLRTVSHEDSPAANILSYMFLTRRSRDIKDIEQTLQYIHQTSADVLNSGDHALMIWILGKIRKVPGMMKAMTAVPTRYATAMLANVGDVKRALRNRFPLDRGRCVAGNIVLEHLLGAAPTRPGTHLGLSLGHYAGKLYMNLNCDPWYCSAMEANQLADLYVNSLQQLITPSTESPNHQAEMNAPVIVRSQD